MTVEERMEVQAKKEFDVDTGTYIEDVKGNDFIGVDKDGDGLIDDVEKLVEEANEKADAYNEEKERERVREMERKGVQDKEEDKDEKGIGD